MMYLDGIKAIMTLHLSRVLTISYLDQIITNIISRGIMVHFLKIIIQREIKK